MSWIKGPMRRHPIDLIMDHPRILWAFIVPFLMAGHFLAGLI